MSTHKQKREVWIYWWEKGNAWLVRYVERRKGQRHCAAQFDARDHSQQWVEDWVRQQPGLELVEP